MVSSYPGISEEIQTESIEIIIQIVGEESSYSE